MGSTLCVFSCDKSSISDQAQCRKLVVHDVSAGSDRRLPSERQLLLREVTDGLWLIFGFIATIELPILHIGCLEGNLVLHLVQEYTRLVL